MSLESAPHRIIVLEGDGIGPEVLRAAIEVLKKIARIRQLDIRLESYPVGGQALEQEGVPLPDRVLEACRTGGIILLGAVGDSRFDHIEPARRPEQALLRLRRELGLYCNLRPVKPWSSLLDSSPLRRSIVLGTDLMIVRELTGGLYFGEPRGQRGQGKHREGFNTMRYSAVEIERIAQKAFELAAARRRKVTSVDKANVLETSRLWREVVGEVGAAWPDVTLEHMLVDNCAMQIVARPSRFDVVLTENLFGDILSDEAAIITGSIGLLPSASLGGSASSETALYEPVHGSAPDIAGKDQANPLAAIGCVALLLRHSLGEEEAARAVEQAVERVLERGHRTADLLTGGGPAVGTREMTRRILEEL